MSFSIKVKYFYDTLQIYTSIYGNNIIYACLGRYWLLQIPVKELYGFIIILKIEETLYTGSSRKHETSQILYFMFCVTPCSSDASKLFVNPKVIADEKQLN